MTSQRTLKPDSPRGRRSCPGAIILILGLGIAGLLESGPKSHGQTAVAILEFSSDIFFAFEDSGDATVTVNRSGDTLSPVSVDYTTSTRLATEGVDYTPQSGTLSFGPSETTGTIVIPLFDDPEAEGSEPIELTLSNPSGGAALGTLAAARMYIQDNEWRGTLLDYTFTGETASTDSINAIAIQPDGKVLAAGVFAAIDLPVPDQLIRLNLDGSRDPSFSMPSGGLNGGIYTVALQADGKIVIGGDFTLIGSTDRGGIARLNLDGSLDLGFDPGFGIEGPVSPGIYGITLQDDDKIIVVGNFETFDGVSRSAVARLDADGFLDATFDPGFGATSTDPNFLVPWVSAAKVQPDGKVVIVGQFTEVDGWTRRNVARLNPDGFVDDTFDPGTGATGNLTSVEAVDLQSDGKIVIGGDFTQVDGIDQIALARLNSDGSVDSSFDTGSGIMDVADDGSDVPGFVTHLIVQDDGKILFGGSFLTLDQINRHGIGRVNPDGSLDSSFGPYLGTTYRNHLGYEEFESVTGLAIQPDGKILTGATFVSTDGSTVNRLTRLVSRNVQSPSFEFDLAGASAGELSDSKTLWVIRRGDSDGAFTVEYATGGGTAAPGGDYLPQTGTLSFDSLEVEKPFTIPILSDTVLEDDETIVVSLLNPSDGAVLGDPEDFEVLIVDGQKVGNVDPSFANIFIPFAPDPDTFAPVTRITIQPDMKVLVAGYFAFVDDFDRFGMVRLEPDGAIDLGFVPEPPPGSFIVEFPQFGLQPDGRIVGGLNGVNRLNSDGSLDADFVPEVSSVISLAMQTDGAFVVNDEFFDPFTETWVDEIVRFAPDGSFDAGFISAGLDDWATAIAIQEDGRVLLGGYFTEVNGVTQNGIARLNADGALDSGFDTGLGIQSSATPVVFAVVTQPDDKVIVGGSFTGVNDFSRINLARLNGDGSVDLAFDAGAGPNNWIEAIAMQADGKILIGGGFTAVDDVPRAGLARLNSDGSLDTSFDPKLTFPIATRITAIAVQPDGQILIGGLFTEVNGLPWGGLARLNGGSNATAVFKLEAGRLTAGTPFRITLATEPGQQYQLQASTDLVSWTLVNSATATAPTLEIEDPDSTSHTSRFYRAILTNP